jgi:alpha-glucosidase (family GH31 glycosyl hydrolase)
MAGFPDGVPWALQAAGDNEPDFGDNGLPSVIVAGQSAALSAYSIWGHDIGGYQDTNFIDFAHSGRTSVVEY